MPTLPRRFGATLIDGFFLIFSMILASVALQGEGEEFVAARIAAFVLIFFVYEPLLTSRLCTLGQYLVGIRVRKHLQRDQRIGIPAAYFRFLLKAVLGGLSFFLVAFSRQRRALHDILAGSIVVAVAAQPRAPEAPLTPV